MDPVKSMFIKLQRNREKVGLKKVCFYLNLRVIHLTLTAMGGGHIEDFSYLQPKRFEII